MEATYSVRPNIAGCSAGTLRAGVTDALLAQLNAIRSLHQLPPVVYSAADEPAAMAASLMFAANRQLSHNPPTSWLCYTAAGASGAETSNISLMTGSPTLPLRTDDTFLGGFMTEVNNLTAENVGHRRWLLHPFLGSIAYGRVVDNVSGQRTDGSAIKVFNNTGPSGAIGALPAFVAYPYGNYPAWLFDSSALFSFSVIADTRSAFGANAQVNFAQATITVRQRSTGQAMTVSRVAYDNVGYGLPNNLQWGVAGLQGDTVYDVTIGNVIVSGGAPRAYSYFFRILPAGQRAQSAREKEHIQVLAPPGKR